MSSVKKIHEELDQLYSEIFSDKPTNQTMAVDIVYEWAKRCDVCLSAYDAHELIEAIEGILERKDRI